MDIRQYLEADEALERDALFCGVDEATRGRLRDAAREILASPVDFAALAEIDAAILRPGEDEWERAPWRDYPRDGLGGAFLLAFPVLHHVGDIRAFYAARGIPEDYARRAMEDLPRWVETYAERTCGRAGFAEVFWLRRHVSGRLFQIGRLQFETLKWKMPWTLLRGADGGFALVARGGDKVSRDGRFASCAGVDAAGAREVVYEERPGGVFGQRALADGTLSREPEFFPASGWTRHMVPGDPALMVHIPGGAPLDLEACRDSLRDAGAFFGKYFPDRPPPRAMFTGTWLLYPGLRELLPPDSNIVGFQKLFRLFPLRDSDDSAFYERIFAPYGRAVTRDKLRTRLQSALFDHIAAGHVPLDGGGIIPV